METNSRLGSSLNKLLLQLAGENVKLVVDFDYFRTCITNDCYFNTMHDSVCAINKIAPILVGKLG